jgi:cysteine desulfurase / selenocysteine lyase
MSTSDPRLELDEAAIAHAKTAIGAAMPDVAAMTQMANAFFRALPGQEVVIAPTPVLPGVPSSAPAYEIPSPQFGVPAPSVPSFPSVDKIPNEADLAHLSGTSIPKEPLFGDNSFIATPSLPGYSAPFNDAYFIPPHADRARAPLAEMLGLSAFASQPQFGVPAPSVPSVPSFDKIPTEADVAGFSGASVPTNVPAEGISFLTTPSLAGLQAPVSARPSALPRYGTPQTQSTEFQVSPFSLPITDFDVALSEYESAVPDFLGLPGYATDDFARSALSGGSSLYFLEPAASLSIPGDAAPQNASIPPDLSLSRRQFDVTSIRRDFPILQEKVSGYPLVWLDNAATTQKPKAVIDRLMWFYEHENSNIHRAAHELAARATDAYEDARDKVAHFLNASTPKEIVFVRGATEAINLVAQGWGRRYIGKDDEIIISWIEHHANIVPWQMLCSEKGARLRVIPVDDDGQILLDEYEKLLNSRTKLVSFTQVSNALGTITPAQQMVQMAHRYGARVLVDGAQAVSHMRVDVQQLDCDFYVFSGHKVFAPTGIGVLYGKQDVLAETPPWQGGGNMIVDVTFEKTIYQVPPGRFEAGTGNIADAVGLGAAIAYLERIGMENIARHEHDLLVYATEQLNTIPGLSIIGTAKEKAGVLSFVLEGYRTEEVGAALNSEGIAVRSGHHCAQPTLRRFGQETTVRPSLALYNNYEDVDAMIRVLRHMKKA